MRDSRRRRQHHRGHRRRRGRDSRGPKAGRPPPGRAHAPGRHPHRGLLAVLVEEPGHGYDVIQRLEEKTGGSWRPSPGSVYPTLQLLEDEGLAAVGRA